MNLKACCVTKTRKVEGQENFTESCSGDCTYKSGKHLQCLPTLQECVTLGNPTADASPDSAC